MTDTNVYRIIVSRTATAPDFGNGYMMMSYTRIGLDAAKAKLAEISLAVGCGAELINRRGEVIETREYAADRFAFSAHLANECED